MTGMESRIWKVFASLGIPGLALGVFYMLFRSFQWQFPEVPPGWVGPIIVLFMLLTSAVVFFALNRWAPNPKAADPVALMDVKDLEEADRIVQELDSGFIELAGSFADKNELRDPTGLSALIKRTDDYLHGRKLLPKLVTIHGSIEEASTDARIESADPGIFELLRELHKKIKAYREILGEGPVTGVGLDALKRLLEKVMKIEDAEEAEREPAIEEVSAAAEEARNQYEPKLSEEIAHLIGRLRTRIASRRRPLG